MTKKTYPKLNHRILVVKCSCEFSESDAERSRNYFLFEDMADAEPYLKSTKYDCVIACIDPTRRDSISDLNKLTALLSDRQVILAIISISNPRWTAALADHLSIEYHFQCFPTEEDVKALSNAAERLRAQKDR
ncbi:MAG: hypothetical protein AAF667_19735 [Pseudomonadota bacterium]